MPCNPFPPNSAAHLDFEIWADGYSAGAGELSFLRAIHAPTNVNKLAIFLRRQNPFYNIRVSSLWLDKFPICRPNASSSVSIKARELGDLGIVVRGRIGARSYVRFWILQGKVQRKKWQNTTNSRKEIELYEQCPEFDLYTSAQRGAACIGTFDLKKDSKIGPPPYAALPFWSYLMFAPNCSCIPICYSNSPMLHQWDSSGSYAVSFAAGIDSMVRNIKIRHYACGAAVNHCNKQWSNLYSKLWEHSGRAIIGTGALSGGSWRTSSFIDRLLQQNQITLITGAAKNNKAPFLYSTGFDHELNQPWDEYFFSKTHGNDEQKAGEMGDFGGMNLLIIDLKNKD